MFNLATLIHYGMTVTLAFMLAAIFVLIIRSHIYYAYSFIQQGIKRVFVLVTRFALGVLGLITFHDLVNHFLDPQYLSPKSQIMYCAMAIILLFRAAVFKVEQASIDSGIKEIIKTQSAPTRSVFATYSFVVAFTGLAFYAGPLIENNVNPILINQRISQVERHSPEKVCWTWSYYKTRDAVLLDYDVFAVDTNNRRLHVNVTRGDGRSIVLNNTRPANSSISVDLCAINLPIQDEPYLLTGKVTYRAYHGLWRIEQELFPVNVHNVPTKNNG